MDNSTSHEIAEHGSTEVPSLTEYFSSNDQVAGFDSTKNATELQLFAPSPENAERPMLKGHVYSEETEGRVDFGQNPHSSSSRFDLFKTLSGRFERHISIIRGKPPKEGVEQHDNSLNNTDRPRTVDDIENATELQFLTPSAKDAQRPMPKGHEFLEETERRVNFPKNPHLKKFDSFKTFSGGLERQISILRRKPPNQGVVQRDSNSNNTDMPTIAEIAEHVSPKVQSVTKHKTSNDDVAGFDSFDNAKEFQFLTASAIDAERPIQNGQGHPEKTEGVVNSGQNPHINGPMLNDRSNRFDSFKTSKRFEGHISAFRGKAPKEGVVQQDKSSNKTDRPRTIDRYYDALEGPELETLRTSEETVLPQDETWPFLLRFPVSSFGMCLGISSQAILWQTLAKSPSTEFLHISLKVNLVLWIISVTLFTSNFIMYLLKIIVYFEAVRREYYHPIRVNFFFAPWITLLLLGVALPQSLYKYRHQALWYILMVPIFLLDLKIFGQWISGSQRRLSKVANPLNHLSVAGNFVGALLGASMGLKEGPLFFFSVGLTHYLVLFVTLYQRLPTAKTLPKELHPVFFLFVAGPSLVSLSWSSIQGSFDYAAKIAFFMALFLYLALALRVNFFRGFKFSLAWWAYTFPMTAAAISTIMYSNQVTTVVTKILSVTLSFISTLIVTSLFVTTIIHAFVLKDLFPNDIAIAISDRPRITHKWFPGSSDEHSKLIETYLKFANTDGDGDGDHGDLEAAMEHPSRPT